MAVNPVINAPAGFVPGQAIMFGTMYGEPTGVDPGHPLPVTIAATPATSAVLSGAASASVTIGPFAPQAGRPIWLCLAGSWTGSATLLRSTDGGVSKIPLTAGGQQWGIFTANANEPVAEETEAGATYYLDFARTSGTLTYRVSQ